MLFLTLELFSRGPLQHTDRSVRSGSRRMPLIETLCLGFGIAFGKVTSIHALACEITHQPCSTHVKVAMNKVLCRGREDKD